MGKDELKEKGECFMGKIGLCGSEENSALARCRPVGSRTV